MVQWTAEQEQAIYTSGSNILVAAAAGSGKTAVLVERIIQKLLNKSDPVDIDSLLVVTFTNAAAQEMRNRVGIALEKALAADPKSNHLKKQLSLLQKASISTLHSFCLEVVKEYAYLLDIDPSFRIANEMEVDLFKQDVLDDLFEEWYGAEDESADEFFAVVDRFSNDRSDVAVESLILDLYTFSVQNPFPEKWLDSLATVYNIPENWEENELQFLDILKVEVNNQFIALKGQMEKAMEIARETDGPYEYITTIEQDLEGLRLAEEKATSWQELQEYMSAYKFARLSSKKMECNEDKKQKVRKMRDGYKDNWNKMKNNYFNRALENHLQDMRELYPVIKKLTELVKEFNKGYSELKKEKAVIDFSDLEHFCLQLLLDENAKENELVPSNVAINFQNKFNEVLVDEYQDTNLVQETIIQLVSLQEGPGNTFMVGDVKQSVYRFRHAEPNLFIEKYKRFAEPDDPGVRIDLARNFRSREEVLVGANYIFRQVLDEGLGEISYDADAELIYGNKGYDDLPLKDAETELIIIDREKAEEHLPEDEEMESFEDLEKAQVEARAYAEKIKQWIGKKDGKDGLTVIDKETGRQRPTQYRDIVILMRSMTWAPTIVDELKKQGIPVYAEVAVGYFEAIEIKIMMSFLKIIDNPRQDIPLASILRSPIVGFNEDELSRIRIKNRTGSFYEALKQYEKEETNEVADRIKDFLDKFEAFRVAAREGALSDLIWDIYRETGYYDFVGGMPGGRQRQANLRALYDRSRAYEATTFRGLFRFLRFIERMEERGDDLGAARALSEQEDVVRIMTIHKSKGLEFPIVILGAMDKEFNFMDLKRKYLLHKDEGFATKFIDPIKRISYTTLYFEAVKRQMLREQLAEEMRVLYVALTRAKEKLVMIGSVNSAEKKLEKWEQIVDHTDWVMPEHYRVGVKSYMDWVAPALIRHEQSEILRPETDVEEMVPLEIRADRSQWEVSIIHASELTNLETTSQDENTQLKAHLSAWEPVPVHASETTDFVKTRFDYEYPYREATLTRAKQTVTEIKRQKEKLDEYSSSQLIGDYKPPIIERPNFLQKEKTLTAAEKGTALHGVMQHIPLDKALTEEEVLEFIEELVIKEILTREAADSVDVSAIVAFYQTPVAKYIREQKEVYRELPFSLTLKAEEIYPDFSGDKEEEVLIQGVIDCLIPKDDGWIILDYKTDTITEEITPKLEEKLIKRYQVQLALYKEAIEKIWKQPVKDTYLYFFSKQLLVKVPTED
ncbi:helicase-exonuclease AddAB subunit AddA [Oceanobacillus sp. CAU 1775]